MHPDIDHPNRHEIKRMIPPGKIQFFFSCHLMQSYIDETDDVHIEECHNFKTLNVSIVVFFNFCRILKSTNQ